MNKSHRTEHVRTYEQVSAGGVVYRRSSGETEIAIIRTTAEGRWQLPKGFIDDGETAEQAALREVREEAGVEAALIAPISTIEYWFTAERDGERRRFHKFVHFFLMSFTAGEVTDHDDEVAEARWIGIGPALELLDFKNERAVVAAAESMIGDSKLA
jgi:8-oxo-dGTP pyrophosphatase MutT (NUDIX family)